MNDHRNDDDADDIDNNGSGGDCDGAAADDDDNNDCNCCCSSSSCSSADTNECIEYFLFGNKSTHKKNRNKGERRGVNNNITLRDIQFATDEIIISNDDDEVPFKAVVTTNNGSRTDHSSNPIQTSENVATGATTTTNNTEEENRLTTRTKLTSNDDNDDRVMLSQQEQQKWFQYAYRTPQQQQQGTHSFSSGSSGSSGSNNCIISYKFPIEIVYTKQKGYQLIATCTIPRNTVLYTESSLFATQIVNQLPNTITRSYSSRSNRPTCTMMNTTTTTNHVVRACQYCYQSLEPMSSLYKIRTDYHCYNKMEQQKQKKEATTTASITVNNNNNNSIFPPLPLSHLYPILEFQYDDKDDDKSSVTTTLSTTTTTIPKSSSSSSSSLNNNNSSQYPYRIDRNKRIQCTNCLLYYCSPYCQKQFQILYGGPNPCCYFQKIIHGSSSSSSSNSKCDENLSDSDAKNDNDCDNENDESDLDHDIDTQIQNVFLEQPAILLAIRMFVATINEVRCHTRNDTNRILPSQQEQQQSSIRATINELCGTYEDVSKLEMGIAIRRNVKNNHANNAANDDTIEPQDHPRCQYEFTVEPIYNRIVQIYSITKEEQQHCNDPNLDHHYDLSLQYFMSCVAKASRNGFGVFHATTSPFQYYYSGIIRSSMYRGSPQHKQYQQDIIRALFPQYLLTNTTPSSTTTTSNTSSSINNESVPWKRGMDRIIDEYVCSKIVALYLLTSRINHSCDPNCVVHTQQYCNNHNIDVVTTRQIEKGEEITINYIGSNHHGNKPYMSNTGNANAGTTIRQTHRRQQELYSKYLFHCNCVLCVPEITTTKS